MRWESVNDNSAFRMELSLSDLIFGNRRAFYVSVTNQLIVDKALEIAGKHAWIYLDAFNKNDQSVAWNDDAAKSKIGRAHV